MKRLLDCALALIALGLLSPVMLATAIVIRLKLGRPVLFRQRRPGLNAIPFEIMKFRTMTGETDGNGNPLPDEKRLTGLGKFLRSTSLDELPELLNVLKGEMSLVGPRPLFMEYLPYYTTRERIRHTVRPGITGWAQIHGRNLLPWDERLALDVWYVENRSLLLDLRILLQTFWKVLLRDGAAPNADDVETDLARERGSRAHAFESPSERMIQVDFRPAAQGGR